MARFHDLESINNYLEKQQHTTSLFYQLDRLSPKRAKRVYNLVEPLLVRAGEYALCAKYLEPSDRFSTIQRTYRVNLRLAKDPTIGSNLVQFAEASFAEKATRLIALLSLNGRVKEAKQMGRQARRVWDNKKFHQRIAAAKHGKFT